MNKKFIKIASVLALMLCLSLSVSEAKASGLISLKDTVHKTLDYNPTVKAFQEYRQAAQHDLRRARSDWFPSVDARAGYGAERWNDQSSRSGLPGTRDSNTYYDRSMVSATVSQIIWDGMATWNRVSLSEHRLDSAEKRLFDNAEALSLDGILAHIEVYRQNRLLSLAELNVNNHKRILASQYERQRSGASTMADVTQTQSRLARTQASYTETQSALEVSQSNYKRLTGFAVTPLDIDTPILPDQTFASLEEALAKSQSGNLKIMAMQSDVEAAQSQVELDKSAFHPTVTLDFTQDYNWRVQGSDTYQWGNSLMLNVNWNLFRGGYDWFNVKGDRARARQSKNELTAQMDAISEETSATWSQLISATEQEKFFADAVEFSTRTRDMYLEQFNVGQRSLLDVLDAENEVYTSAIQLVTSQQNIIAAQYRLLALAGGLLANFDINRNELAIQTDPAHVTGY